MIHTVNLCLKYFGTDVGHIGIFTDKSSHSDTPCIDVNLSLLLNFALRNLKKTPIIDIMLTFIFSNIMWNILYINRGTE